MIYKKKCKICGKEFETKYYQKKYCDNKHYLKCIICGKDFEVSNNIFSRSEKNWPKTCSRHCQDILIKQTCHKRYGSDLCNSKKAKETRFKRYGAYESGKSKEKRKDTTQKKYGRNCNIDLEKARETKLERYDDENYNNREKAKQTSLKIWGVDNPSKSKEVKQKIINTNLKHWGVDYTFKTENNKIKSRKTKKEKYGDETFTNPDKANRTKLKRNNGVYQSKETTEKIRAKKKSLYGYTSWNINKAKETILNKYGVPYYCMTEECRKLAHTPISQNNLRFKEKLEQLGYEIQLEFAINNFQYDLKVNNILIEIDPTFTHNSFIGPKFSNDSIGKPKDKNYHYIKTKNAIDNNYRCIHIFDWDNIYKILQLFYLKTNIYARFCDIKEVSKEDCNNFLNKYHLQNTCKGQTIRLGLYYKDELIEIMTFGRPRYNKKFQYELLRLCTKSKYQVIGGTQKLFKYFLEEYNPTSIISYCDLSKFSGDVYDKLGFKLKNRTNPSCHWSKGDQMITNNLLLQRGYDQLFGTNFGKGTSNEQLMIENGWLPVYDCGQAVYQYIK